MDTTLFLAQLWAPVLLAVGVGIFASREYYVRTYQDIEKQTFSVLVFAMIAIAAGVAHIQAHNIWTNIPEGIISFLGWGLLIKGILFAISPKLVDRAGDWEADSNLIPVAASLMLLLGAYLAWFSFSV